jgi:hypothetical protein
LAEKNFFSFPLNFQKNRKKKEIFKRRFYFMNTWQNLKQACFAAGMSAITVAAAKTAAILTEAEPKQATPPLATSKEEA